MQRHSTTPDLWTTRECLLRLIAPCWQSTGAQLISVAKDLPRQLECRLRFFSWELRLQVLPAPFEVCTEQPAILISADIRSASAPKRVAGALATMSFDAWTRLASTRVEDPVTDQGMNRALVEIKNALWSKPDVNDFLNRHYTYR